jgi:carbon monoxide dehydrogenase subunit G
VVTGALFYSLIIQLTFKEAMKMAKVERSIIVNAPVEKVFSYISDPNNELDSIPSITDIRDIKGEGVGQKWGWSYKMVGFSLKGESEVTEHIPNQRFVHKSKGGIQSTWTYTFSPENGGTKLNVVVEYTIPIPVLGKVGERMVLNRTEREADLAMTNIKEKLES